MLGLIRELLQQFIDDIDSGNSRMSQEQQLEALSMLYKLTSNELSKIEAAEYIGVSRATFDNYINKGLIPKGRKRQGFKELSWNKSDLNKFIDYANTTNK